MDVKMPNPHTLQEGLASQRLVKPSQLHDPLLFLLKDTLRLNEWWIITVWGMNLTAGFLPIEIFNHTAVPPDQILAFATTSLIMVGIYLSLPSAMVGLFNRLWENGVIGNGHVDTPGSPTYLEFVKRQAHWIHSRWWIPIALLGATSGLFFFFFSFPGLEILRNVPLWFQFIFIFWTFVNYYTYIFVTIWLVLIAVATRRLFRAFAIRAKPLHPDGSGGLGPFNRLLWISIPLLIIVASIVLVSVGSTISPGPVLISIIIYLFLAFLPLSVWLISPHQAMVQERNKLLQRLANEYERALGETMSGALDNTIAINEGTELLNALRKRYEEIRNSFPTWPIEIIQLRGLVILLILPILLAVLPSLINLFAKK